MFLGCILSAPITFALLNYMGASCANGSRYWTDGRSGCFYGVGYLRRLSVTIPPHTRMYSDTSRAIFGSGGNDVLFYMMGTSIYHAPGVMSRYKAVCCRGGCYYLGLLSRRPVETDALCL